MAVRKNVEKKFIKFFPRNEIIELGNDAKNFKMIVCSINYVLWYVSCEHVPNLDNTRTWNVGNTISSRLLVVEYVLYLLPIDSREFVVTIWNSL